MSFETPEYTANADAMGTLRLLEAVRMLGKLEHDALLSGLDVRNVRPCRRCRSARGHRFIRARPYGAAKVYAYWITVNYREAYGIHASNGILLTTRVQSVARRS